MYKLLFIVIALFVIVGGVMISNCNTTEHFTDDNTPITAANISDYIYKVYKADVKAIQNLADIAIKLQAGGITVPGSMTVSNQLNVLNGISLTNNLTFNQGGRKIILYNGNPDNNMNPDGLYLHFYNTGGGWISNPLVINEGLMRIPQDLTVGGNIRGPTIDDLYKKIAALEAKLNNIFNGNVNINGSLTIQGNLEATRLDANSKIPGGNSRYVFNVWGGPSSIEGWGNRILVYPDTFEPNKFYNLFSTRYWQPNVGAAYS